LESRNLPSGLTGGTAPDPVLSPAGTGSASLVLEGPNSAAAPQDLGTLAPSDLANGITVIGGFQSEAADYYQFQVTKKHEVIITVSNQSGPEGMPVGNWLTVTDTTTNQPLYLWVLSNVYNPTSQVTSTGQILVLTQVAPGTSYVVHIANWAPDALYGFRIGYPGSNPEMPQPLTLGAAAAIRLRLLDAGGNLAPGAAPSVSTPAPPAIVVSATGSVVLPTTVAASSDGTGIVPASNVVGSGAGNSVAPSGNNNVPTAVYAALGTGSVGGFLVTNNGSPSAYQDLYDRIYGQAPALALSERLLGLAILSQVGTTTHVDVSEPVLPPASTDTQTLKTWWQSLLRLGGQDAGPPAATSMQSTLPATSGVLKADVLPEEEDDLLLQDQPEAWAPRGREDTEGTEVVLDRRAASSDAAEPIHATLAVSVLFAALGGRQRRQRRPVLCVQE